MSKYYEATPLNAICKLEGPSVPIHHGTAEGKLFLQDEPEGQICVI